MSGNQEQKKKMMIAVVAVVAIVGAGGMLAYYYDLFPGSSKPQGSGAPDISTLPPQMQEEARKAEEAAKADAKNPRKPKAGS